MIEGRDLREHASDLLNDLKLATSLLKVERRVPISRLVLDNFTRSAVTGQEVRSLCGSGETWEIELAN